MPPFTLANLAPWRRIVVSGAPGTGKTGTVREALRDLQDVAGFVQEANDERDQYVVADLRSDARRLVAWRTAAGMQFDQAAFALAASWLVPARVLVLDEIGWVEAKGGGHAPSLENALTLPSHVLCTVRADRWEAIRTRFDLGDAIVLSAGDVSGVRALLETDFALAQPHDIEQLQALERRGDERFAGAGHPELADGEVMPTEAAARAVDRGQIVVARRGETIAGFAYVGTAGDEPCLGQISVDPAHGRIGVGTALLRVVQATLRQAGARTLVLGTQRDVPWNRPWYERHGFTCLEPGQWTEAMHAITRAQSDAGLDAASRVHMRCSLVNDAP